MVEKYVQFQSIYLKIYIYRLITKFTNLLNVYFLYTTLKLVTTHWTQTQITSKKTVIIWLQKTTKVSIIRTNISKCHTLLVT